MSEWIKCCERMPQFGETVQIITVRPNNPLCRRLAEYWDDGFWVHGALASMPTHWTPVPEPPKGDE